jgi:hypothetical protein
VYNSQPPTLGAGAGSAMTDAATPRRQLYVVSCRFDALEHLAAWHRWYDDVHVPALLDIPGFLKVSRYAQLGSSDRFLAVWEVAGPWVFAQPEYQQARGWGPWGPYIAEWSALLLEEQAPESPAASARPT